MPPRFAGKHLAAAALSAALCGAATFGITPTAVAAADARSETNLDAIEDKVGIAVEPPASGRAREENAELAALASLAEQAVAEILDNAWQLPVAKSSYQLTARFGECSALWSYCHTGLDFAAPEGTPVVAVANGTITAAGWAGAYGNRTILTLEDGTEIWYCHQSAIGVQPGDVVAGGQEIGRVGSTGNSTGPHLHLEVRPGAGDAVDPYQALIVHGVQP